MSEKHDTTPNIILTVLRASLGFIFFWAGIDKLFGLGYRTSSDNAIINGGKATYGFLISRDGWFADIFNPMAGNAIVEFLFITGLLGIGLSLIIGIGYKIGGISGFVLMMLMYFAELPFIKGVATNPMIDDHIIYGLFALYIAFSKNIGYILIPQWKKVADKYPVLA